MDDTAMTLGQGHGIIIQYMLPDLYILCPKYLRCSSNGFDVRSRVVVVVDAADVAADAVETNWKHKVTQTGVT